MFDGAAATAADQHHADASGAADSPADHAVAEPIAFTPPVAAPRHLLVIDSRLEDREQLTAQVPPGVAVLTVNTNEDGLAAISAVLAQLGEVDSIQILSHGAAGQFTLGSRRVSSDNVEQLSATLGSWRSALTADADIQLYGCSIGAGSAGQILVNEIARWTGADVAASTDSTGGAAAGGNWVLETNSGTIDQPLALSSEALTGFAALLADAAPTVTLSAGGTDALLGAQFSFTATFSNASAQVGFAPYIDVFIPATGRDGDDGATFVSATYLGQTIKSFVITFDTSGNATHPLAVDTAGAPLVINAATYGLRAGDQLVVLQLPSASQTADQPSIDIRVTAQLSNLADTSFSNGAPDLTIRARGGFQFGNDSANDPAIDPTLIEAGTHAFVVHPTVVSLSQSINAPDGSTVSGPNYSRSITVTVAAAAGQTLTNVVVTQQLPEDIFVTAITPQGGGVLQSVTFSDGVTLSSPVLIQAAINRGAFIESYSIEYASLTGTATTNIQFYVPGADANGNPVIDAIAGNSATITVNGPTASGTWTPLDPRDLTAPETFIPITGTGSAASFVAQSIAVYKEVTLQADIGQAGLTPGDTLQYSLRIDMSDYFAFGENLFESGQFVIQDTLADGQLVTGVPTLSFTVGGVSQSIALVTTVVNNPDGTTSLALDIAQSLRNAGRTLGALAGDLAFDDVQQGATAVLISYSALIAQSYTSTYTQSEINEGDSFGNNATVTATVLEDPINLTGGVVSESDSTSSTIGSRNVGIDIVTVNGGTPPTNGELRPGDVVTFRLSYNLLTGDYEQLNLTSYLPLPLFDVTGITWTQGNGVGQWSLGAGNTNSDAIDSVTSGAGNSVIVNFGSYATSSTGGSRIEVQFTLQVGDDSFADQRAVTALGQSDQLRTITGQHLQSTAAVVIVSIAEPVLALRHGVVASTQGTVAGTTGTWNAPGSGGVPFAGSVTDLAAIEGSVTGIDAGDILRLATAIENSGGGAAFDVATTVTLPAGLSFLGGSLASANLRLYRGDGSQLIAGVDYSVSGNSITFLDANGIATLGAGRAGTAADTSGANLVVITYDVTVDAGIPASRTLQTSASLDHYASVNGGSDFTPSNPFDTANQQVAAPGVIKVFAGGSLDGTDSSATHTAGSDLVVGESMLFDIVVTLPEGSTQSLRIDDLVPAGLRLDTSFNGTGYQIITTAAGSAALSANFNGTVVPGSFTAPSGTLGNDGVDARLVFSASAAAADNVTGNNSFVIRVRLVLSNVANNQANRSLQNSAQIVYSDPDTDTVNGSTVIDRTVAPSGGLPTVTVREPTLTITQTTNAQAEYGVDQGDAVEYLIEIRNGSTGTDFDAFDITFSDTLPTTLDNLTLTGVTYAGGATNNGGADFTLTGGVLQSAGGANIDIPRGGSIVLRVTGVVNAGAASTTSIDNVATVQWTSLNGAVSGERTGADGSLGGGALNDYRSSYTLDIRVQQGNAMSRIGGLDDTPAPASTYDLHEQAAIGEVIRYRTIVAIAQGSTTNYNLQVTLQNGLGFVNDGTVRLAFISNGGITTDVTGLITGGVLNIVGNRASPEAAAIATDLSGAAPTGVLNPAQIAVTTDGSGNTVITFSLGTLVNGDLDADIEGLSLEFNARILNQASNLAGVMLGASTVSRSGTTVLSTSETLFEDVVEPAFSGLVKQVYDFVPNIDAALGTANVSVRFTQSGGVPAYDIRLADSFPAATGYSFIRIEINDIAYTAGNLPAGITVDMTTGLRVDFTQLNVGDRVAVFYEATVPDAAAIPNTNATLTWSSLPEDFTTWGGSTPGTDGGSTGERTGSETGPNNYVLREGAGLGFISGTLWDDTASATGSTTADGPGLTGQTVTLTWAGADGNLATAGDNRVFTTVTNGSGEYRFGALPAGVFRIDTPGTITNPQPQGELRVRIDTDAGSALGQIIINAGEGATVTANAGYVQRNDAPVNNLPGTQNGSEDIPLSIGGPSVTDIDAGSGTLDVVLTVLQGTLSLSTTPGGVVVGGSGTATLTLSGTVTNLNLALANLVYLGNANYNGIDTLTFVSRDRGNFGDLDGDGIPGESTQDQLTDTDTLQIVLVPVNDPPTAVADTNDATEAGGTANRLPGINPAGNLLDNDTDVDIASNADQLHLTAVRLLPSGTVATPGTTPVEVIGLYGSLFVTANGGYQYVVDNGNAAVQALRLTGQTLSEQFAYTCADIAGVTSSSTLTITVHGANDAPVAVNDNGSAAEAGGALNGTAGSDATGNVLTNDTDVDTLANGESRSLTGIRHLRESVAGALTAVAGGTNSTNGTVIAGTYGSLTIGADGSYRYVIDNSSTAVQRLVVGDTLIEYFSYEVTDAGVLHDIGEVRIVIQGANDNPLASDDAAAAQAASTNGNSAEANPAGNVILFPSRPGTTGQAGGNGVDQDVDRTDRPGSVLVVTGVRTGLEGAVASLTAVSGATTSANGTQIVGSYGTLRIGADGSFFYDVDSTNVAVQALQAGQTLTDEVFTYELTDTSGLHDLAELRVTVRGVNDPPVAQNVVALAQEAGGVGNGTAGINPAGDAVANDFDPDGDVLTVTAVRTGAEGGGGTSGTVGQALAGQYGSLTLNASGTYTYVVNNANADVQALREPADLLTERFTYTINDGNGETDQAEIIVVIRGQNDTPQAVDDAANATEAGGVANNQPGIDPAGNVLTNDIDVDGGAAGPIDYDETRTVSTVRTGTESGSGAAGVLGTELRGNYGWLLLNTDGSYSYRVDNSLAAVQALRGSTNTLADSFSYTVIDAAGATDRATLAITIRGANDVPVAQADAATAIEASGIANGTAGSNPAGNVLSNDSDVDAGDALSIVGVRQGIATGSVGSAFAGTYGSLLLNADGSYTYVLDNSNAAVQALRTSADQLSETFTYTLRDLAGATTSSTLTLTIQGRNDTPVAVNDSASATEAGGTFNGTAGIDPTGNLLANDTDVDGSDTKTVNGIRTGAEAGGGAFTAVAGSQALTGLYGTLNLAADGSYTYQVNNALAAVQALRAGETLVDLFAYRMRDTAGATDTAEFRLVVTGAWDAPVASNESVFATTSNSGNAGTNPSGNVLANDTDVDRADVLTITGIRTGTEVAGGGLTAVPGSTNSTNGTLIAGQYGELIIGADGTAIYRVDSSNPTLLALGPLQFVTDSFTYQVCDLGGLTDLAQLNVLVRGRNENPIAVTDGAIAIEAGGLNNAIPGANPSGNVLGNDTDVESDALEVVNIRTGGLAGSGSTGTVGQILRGAYGDMTLNANGSWSYTLDNSIAAIQALRATGQTLTDAFTYTITDLWGATSSAELNVVVDGRNDTPVAIDDGGTAVEAGGVFNGSPGVNPAGNVLTNDTDVDGIANGETRQALRVSNSNGQSANAGQPLNGVYGRLTLNADGSYQYVVDNGNAAVQSLRSASETLSDVFTYRMRDAAGAESEARLTIVLQGANDNPVAADDSTVASDQYVAPQTRGNVLPNDTDVDGGEQRQVTAIRAGAETAAGAAGVVGQSLTGRYGALMIQNDGSYQYTIDLTNREVLAAAGLGQVLQDVFTYTVSDRAGASDQAMLVVHLDISAPFIPAEPGPNGGPSRPSFSEALAQFVVQPRVFIGPVVETNALVEDFLGPDARGADPRLVFDAGIRSPSLGADLGVVGGQFVGQSVRASSRASERDLAMILARHGRTSLSADGLLPDPSPFAAGPDALVRGAAQGNDTRDNGGNRTASSFRDQLRAASRNLNPF